METIPAQNNAINFIRWIAFVPVAIVASAFLSGIFAFVGSALFQELGPVIGGLVAAVSLITLGFKIAPRKTVAVKWILIICCMIIGALSTLGSIFAGKGDLAFLGAVMTVSSLMFVRRSPEQMSR